MAVHLHYVHAATRPPDGNEAWYLEVSYRHFHTLRHEGLWVFLKAYARSFSIWAPLLAVLPLPLYVLFGLSYDTALGVNLLAMPLLAGSVYRLGRRLGGATTGLLAGLITLTFPLVLGISRWFVPDFLAAALVAASLCVLCDSDGLRRAGSPWVLGVLLGLGALTKLQFALYVLGPILLVLWEDLRRRRGASLHGIEAAWKKVFYTAAAVSLTWYGANLPHAFFYLYSSGFGHIAAAEGWRPGVLDPALILGLWTGIINEAVSSYYFLGALAVGAALALRGRVRRHAAKAWENPCLRIVAVWLLAPLAFLHLLVDRNPVRFLPCLPAFALLLGYGLDRLSRGWPFRPVALSLVLAAPAYQCLATAVPSTFRPLPVAALGQLVIFAENTRFNYSPASDRPWRRERLVEELYGTLKGRSAVIGAGFEHVFLHAGHLNQISARRNYPIVFIEFYSVSKGEMGRARVLQRLRDQGTDYLLMAPGLPVTADVPGIRESIRHVERLLAAGRLPFRLVREFELGPGVTLALYERYGRIRM